MNEMCFANSGKPRARALWQGGPFVGEDVLVDEVFLRWQMIDRRTQRDGDAAHGNLDTKADLDGDVA